MSARLAAHEELELGSAPHGEDCAQLGDVGYGVRAFAEIAAYRRQLGRVIAEAGRTIPTDLRFKNKANHHDFGTYHELAISWPSGDEQAEAFAFWLEDNLPETWDDEARYELGLEGAVGTRDLVEGWVTK